jgi:hypothetical protein
VSLAADDPMRTGITVAPAKLFDNRSLVIMLEQLEQQLQSIRVVDSQKDKLLAALTNFQGARITDVSRAISVTGPSLPKVTTKEEPGTEDKSLRPTERTTEEAASTPTPPPLGETLSTLSMSPSFGSQAEDVLSDQVSLTYQIINVRMLLERALSDRLYKKEPRVQVVLGFQIGIDPPKEARDKAAFVEMTVSGPNGKPLSVVSVMPYEKTYNAFAIHRRSNAFGGAAVAKVISLGYQERRRSETLYVYKDADTLAHGAPVPGPESEKATFGWEFRPVLGRHSVSPGLRQMFAVIALPVADGSGTTALDPLKIEVTTYWRKYDASKSIASGKREIVEFSKPLGSVEPMRTDDITEQLGPRIDDVQWRATDDKTAVVQIAGDRLFSGTQVMLGPKIYSSAATGLIFKSDHLIELRTTVSELAFGDGAVSGRYGKPVALASLPKAPVSPSGIAVNDVRFRDDPGREFLPVTVVLQTRDGSPLTLPPEQPLMSVGSEVASSVYAEPRDCLPMAMAASAKSPTLSRAVAFISSSPPTGPTPVNCWQFTGMVTAARLRAESVVSLKYPFRGDIWQASFPIYPPFTISGITNLGTFEVKKGTKVTRLAITGRGFMRGGTQWTVILDRDYKASDLRISDTILQLDVAPEILAGFKSIIVQPSAGNPVVLKLPDGKPAPLEPALDGGQAKTVRKETSVAVVFTGKDLKGIKAAKFDGKPLTTEVSDDGKSITLFLTREVTAKLGVATILLEKENGLISVTVTVES